MSHSSQRRLTSRPFQKTDPRPRGPVGRSVASFPQARLNWKNAPALALTEIVFFLHPCPSYSSRSCGSGRTCRDDADIVAQVSVDDHQQPAHCIYANRNKMPLSVIGFVIRQTDCIGIVKHGNCFSHRIAVIPKIQPGLAAPLPAPRFFVPGAP